MQIIEGKTKQLIPNEDVSAECTVIHKHIVSWNDKHIEPMAGKGNWSCETNANISEILRTAGEPVTFLEKIGPNMSRELLCERMIRLEVIVRNEVDAKSSYLTRNPQAAIGTPFPKPIVEFFLKTDGPAWGDIALTDTDPFIAYFDDSGVWVHHSKNPVCAEGIRFVPAEALGWDSHGMWPFAEIREMSLRSFAAVRREFLLEDFNLKDWKEEYGYAGGKLTHADVYDNDMWRIEDSNGREYSKQVIRNRGHEGIEASKADYAFIAQLTGKMLENVRARSMQ